MNLDGSLRFGPFLCTYILAFYRSGKLDWQKSDYFHVIRLRKFCFWYTINIYKLISFQQDLNYTDNECFPTDKHNDDVIEFLNRHRYETGTKSKKKISGGTGTVRIIFPRYRYGTVRKF